jgi:ribonuclease Z
VAGAILYSNTEVLDGSEMRVIALGTGRRFIRSPQANTSWLVELGNGDKFVFDFGAGSHNNFISRVILPRDMTAYFATHLHADHVGDFAQMWIGGWAAGRSKPLVIYGPSGTESRFGTKHSVQSRWSRSPGRLKPGVGCCQLTAQGGRP